MKKVKILTIALAILAITMIAFLGVYTPVQNRMENQVKDYDLAMNLKGSRNVRLKVNTDSEEEKTVDNYKKSKEIMETRLQKLGLNDYIIKLDEQTGDIVIEMTENNATDQIISNLSTKGKFEIVDSETKEVLMNNSDIKQARVMYGSGSSSSTTSKGTSVYLEIEFNKEGTQKLENITNEYKKEEESSETNTTENTTAEEEATDENDIEESVDKDDTTEENVETEKKITMNLDDEEVLSTNFEETIRNGKIQLSIGAASTDQATLQGYVNQASSVATVLNIGSMPVKYELDENQYVLSDITGNEMQIAIYVILGIMVLALIMLLVRHKKLGALGIISYIGFVSLLILIVRYANVVLSIEGIFGIVIVFILNYILMDQLLKRANERKTVYKDFFIKIIPIIIMVITFSFINWIPISSFGMTIFWGIALIALYNLIVTNILLKIES